MMKARYFDKPPHFELWGDTQEALISVACVMTDPTHPERFRQHRVSKDGPESVCYVLGGPPPEST